MKQHLKDAKHARTKATKRERLKPKQRKRWVFPVCITLVFIALVYAASNLGDVSASNQAPQIAQKLFVTPANVGVHSLALLTDRQNQSIQSRAELNYTESANPSAAPGLVAGRLSYRASGEVRTMTGNVDTPFRFNGYVSDGGGELSSPSRYYSPSTGRFTSMDPAAAKQMDPLSWNAYVGLNANPMANIDPDGREAWNTETILLNQRAASRNPADAARIDAQLSAYKAQQAIEIQKSTGVAFGMGDTLAETAVGVAVLAEMAVKTQVAHSSNGMVFGDQISQNERSAAVVTEFMVNHPYDRTVNSLSNEFSEIDSLEANGDYFDAYRRGSNLAGHTALSATGAYGVLKGGAALAGRAAGKVGAAFSEANAAARGAAVFDDVNGARAMDAEMTTRSYNWRVANGVEPVTVVEGAGLESTLVPKPTIVPDYGSGRGRRGTHETRAHIDQVRDDFLKANPTYEHVAGGTSQVTGQQMLEEFLPGATGTRKGGSFPDLTFKAPDGSRIRINTVDVDATGVMTGRERVNLDRIYNQTGETVIAIPKPLIKPKKN